MSDISRWSVIDPLADDVRSQSLGVQGLRNGGRRRKNSTYVFYGWKDCIGMKVTVAQWYKGEITETEASFDLAMGAIVFTGWGAPFSLVYFGGKFLYEYSTGRPLFDKPGEN